MNSAKAKHKMVVGCDEHNSTALNNKHYTKKDLSKVPTRRQKCFHVIARKVCWFTVPPQTWTRGTANCRSNLSNSSVTRNNSNFLLGVYDSLVQHNAIRIRLVSPLPWLRSHFPAWKLGRKVVSSGKVPHAWIDYLHIGLGKLSENDWFLLVFCMPYRSIFQPGWCCSCCIWFLLSKACFLRFKVWSTLDALALSCEDDHLSSSRWSYFNTLFNGLRLRFQAVKTFTLSLFKDASVD